MWCSPEEVRASSLRFVSNWSSKCNNLTSRPQLLHLKDWVIYLLGRLRLNEIQCNYFISPKHKLRPGAGRGQQFEGSTERNMTFFFWELHRNPEVSVSGWH